MGEIRVRSGFPRRRGAALALLAAVFVVLPSAAGAFPFDPAVNYATGDLPLSVTTGRFDADADVDLAVANANSDTVSVLLGNGDGTFAAAVDFATGDFPFSVTTGLFDGDADLDLAVANSDSGTVSVLLGNGDGTFAAAVDSAAGNNPFSVTTGLFDGDANLDLAVANASSGTVSVLLGNGDGTFGAATNFATGNAPFSVTTGLFDGDANLDLAVANANSSTVSVLLGNGDGTFGAATNFATGVDPRSVTAGLFDADANVDLAVANFNSNTVSVLLGNGDGTFAAATNFATGSRPISVTTGLFDGDADLDLAVANVSGGTVSVLLGNGDGTFAAATNFATGIFPVSVTAGLFDAGADVDLAVANSGGDNVSVLLSEASDVTAPVVTITLTPAAPDGSNGWYVSPVGVTVSADDGSGSGVAETRCVLDPASTPATFADLPASCAVTSVGADGAHVVYAASKDNDDNTSAVVSSSFKIDQTDPTVICGIALPGPVFLLQGAGGNVSATVTDATSGAAPGTESAGANVATVGNKTVSLTGEDEAGNSTNASCPYRVSYRFLGFQSLKSSYKRGTAIPVKFMLANAAGTTIPDADAQALLTPCRVKVTLDGVEQAGCASYNATTNTFQYDLKTSKSVAVGNHTLAIKVSAPDGSGVVNTNGTTITIT